MYEYGGNLEDHNKSRFLEFVKNVFELWNELNGYKELLLEFEKCGLTRYSTFVNFEYNASVNSKKDYYKEVENDLKRFDGPDLTFFFEIIDRICNGFDNFITDVLPKVEKKHLEGTYEAFKPLFCQENKPVDRHWAETCYVFVPNNEKEFLDLIGILSNKDKIYYVSKKTVFFVSFKDSVDIYKHKEIISDNEISMNVIKHGFSDLNFAQAMKHEVLKELIPVINKNFCKDTCSSLFLLPPPYRYQVLVEAKACMRNPKVFCCDSHKPVPLEEIYSSIVESFRAQKAKLEKDQSGPANPLLLKPEEYHVFGGVQKS